MVVWTPSLAQRDPPQKPDSVPPTVLGEIVVSARADQARKVLYTERRVELVAIQSRDAAVVSDIARLIPAAHLQTNSRGETLVYLRNAGERQVAVFFEGALLNVPWDNRVDLSLVPASVIGGISVAKGVPPVEYGTNVLGGAVNLTARHPAGPWSETELFARYGSQDRVHSSITHRGTAGRFHYTGAVSYTTVDGFRVSDNAVLPFSQSNESLRTNSDSRVANVFGHGVYTFDSGTRIGVSLLHVDARKGVPPEGHLDPAISRVRFWRYPDWRNTTAIASAEGAAGATAWKGSGWVTSFAQTIESYSSSQYDQLDERQFDDDFVVGTRFVISKTLGSGVGKLAWNGLTSTHKQQEAAFEPDGSLSPGQPASQLEFREHLISIGGEYAFSPVTDLNITVGGSFDAMATPETGDKPDRDPFTDFSATFGATYQLPSGWFIRGSVGRKTRFPTMRELFGDALNRFLINPGLRPESSILTEIGFGLRSERFSGEVVPFGTFTSNTIEQESVQLPEETRPRRRRTNVKGSRVLGVELVGTARPHDLLTIQGYVTIMNVKRLQDDPTDPTALAEKPEVLGQLGVEYNARTGTSFLVETVYTGHAYSLDDSNEFVPLPTSLVVNLRISQTFDVTPARTLELFARADNITDELVLPQSGLPAAGRSASGGVKVLF